MQSSNHTLDVEAQILKLMGDPKSFDQGFRLLMQTYRERLYGQIRRMVQIHADADDVLQNTFIKAYKGIAHFEGKSKLSTWLFRIAMNESITFCEARNRKSTVLLDLQAYPVAQMKADSLGQDAEEISLLLSKAMDALPEKQRLVFNLRYFDEMPYEQMSEMLDTSVGALKASFHHAVKKVERYLLDTEL